MNAEVFAEWLRRQGHHVIRTQSSYWYDQGPRVYQAFPYHWLIEPDADELRPLLHLHGLIGLRYSTPVTSGEGYPSYHVVYDQPTYAIEHLPRKARYDVRQGLKQVQVAPLSFARLAAEGWPLRHETLVRQGRTASESASWWQSLCLSAEGLAGFEAWGAFHDGQMVAALLAFQCDQCLSILYQQSASGFLKYGVNNALTYVVTREVLNRPAVKQIFYGLHSLDAPPSVDQFKFRMNYRAKPVGQRVVFHPWFAPLVNRATHALLCGLLRWKPGHPTVSKAEGMFRFYLHRSCSTTPCVRETSGMQQ